MNGVNPVFSYEKSGRFARYSIKMIIVPAKFALPGSETHRTSHMRCILCKRLSPFCPALRWGFK